MLRADTRLVFMLSLAVAAGAPTALGQYSNYSQYYQKSINPAVGRYAASGPNAYLYDKFFYHRPTVSPWVTGAVRGGSAYGDAYTTSIRPELQRRAAESRRQAQYVQQRKLAGNVGYTAYPGAGFYGGTAGDAYLKPTPGGRTTPGFYHNQWYGGWNNR